jgi:small subunit ribosomal protein S20
MANHASAEKRNRQRIERTNRNRAVKSAVRTAVRRARAAIAGGDTTKAAEPVKLATKALAKAASKGVIPTRAASRVTSRIEAALAKSGRPAS